MVTASPSAAQSCPGFCSRKRTNSSFPRHPGASSGKDAGPSSTSSTSCLLFFFKKPDGANSQPLLELADPLSSLRVEPGGGSERTAPVGAFCARPPHLGNRFAFFFFRTPRRMTANLKESGVSCVPHGAWGKEMIKAVRFPGSSRCLRWVLIWEQSEERLRPVPISQHPESVWVADDKWGRVGSRASIMYSSGCRSMCCVWCPVPKRQSICVLLKHRNPHSCKRRTLRFFQMTTEGLNLLERAHISVFNPFVNPCSVSSLPTIVI